MSAKRGEADIEDLYPVEVRPLFTLKGEGRSVANSKAELIKAIRDGVKLSPLAEVSVRRVLPDQDAAPPGKRCAGVPDSNGIHGARSSILLRGLLRLVSASYLPWEACRSHPR